MVNAVEDGTYGYRQLRGESSASLVAVRCDGRWPAAELMVRVKLVPLGVYGRKRSAQQIWWRAAMNVDVEVVFCQRPSLLRTWELEWSLV